MDSIQVRPARADDVTAIQSVARESWLEAYDGIIPIEVQRQAIAKWYSSEALGYSIVDSIFLVAESPDGVIGFAHLVTASDATWELARIYVLPAHQRCGIGAKLLRKALDLAREWRIQRVTVTVAKQNEKGCSFYERNGFSRAGEWTSDLFGFALEEVMYVCRLTGPER
jgi:GNAT superfamily N-acetyltransferase